MRSLRIFAILLGMLLVAAQQQPSKSLKLSPQGYVNDFAGVINADTRKKIETLCLEIDQKAHAQIAVVTVTSLQGESVDQFTIDLAMGWGIGPKGTKRGVLVLLAPAEHKYRIEVGYGLESILPDGKVGTIGREAVPLLKDGDYSGAVMLMTQRVAEIIAADQNITLASLAAAPKPLAQKRSTGVSVSTIIVAILVLFWIFGMIMRFRNGSRGGRRRGGSIAPWFIGGGGFGGFGGGGFSGGGSWGGGGGGGGGGFGGFGGGSFGGGGASGSW